MSEKYVTVKVKLSLPNTIVNDLLSKYDTIDEGINATVISALYKDNKQNNGKTAFGIINRSYAAFKLNNKVQYSKSELRGYVLQTKKFNKLFKKYKDSGFEKALMPSLIMATKLSDITCITFAKRMKINHAARSTPVAYIENGEAELFPSINACAKAKNVSANTIYSILKKPEMSPYREVLTIEAYEEWVENKKNYDALNAKG